MQVTGSQGQYLTRALVLAGYTARWSTCFQWQELLLGALR